jgi:lipoprotein-releasing system permease protein
VPRAFADEDDQALALLVAAAPLAALAGFVLGVVRKDSRFGRLASGGFLGALVSVVAVGRFPEAGIASELYRTLLVLSPFTMLSYVVGGAVAYVLFGGGRFDPRFSFESFIGMRYLRSLRGSVLSIVTIIALLGVILGTGLLIVGLAVRSGFEGDLVEKIIGAHAHVSVSTFPGYLLDQEDADKAKKEAAALGAKASAVFVASEVLIASDSNHTEARLYGIDPPEARAVYGIFGHIVKGGVERMERRGKGGPLLPPPTVAPERAQRLPSKDEDALTPERPRFPEKRPAFDRPSPLAGIVIGIEMARQLHVEVDDTVVVASPMVEELTPQGPAPKTKSFRVAAIFDMRMYEFDAHYVYVLTKEAQRFLEIGDNYSGVSFSFPDPNVTMKVAPKLLSAMGGYPMQVQSWQEKNKNLFLSLKLEKAVAFIVLVFIVLVAAFAIINTLTMTVIEKAREIAILKTMGASDVSISKLFVVQGAMVGAVGTAIGAVFGVALALVLSLVRWPIDPEVAFLDHLPIRLHLIDIVQVCALSLVLTSLSAVFPALSAARLEPVEGLRYE